MTRIPKRKSVGFALVLAAALAIGAMATLSAHGDESNNPHFTAFNTKTKKHEPTTIIATSEGAALFETAVGVTVKCTHPEYEIVFAEEVSETLTVKPKYAGTEGDTESAHCETNGIKTDVNTEGCDFKLSIVSTISDTLYTGSQEIVCPGGAEIDIAITKAGGTCTVQIPPQTVTHLYYLNTATDLTIEPILQLVKFKTSGGVTACGRPNGNYTGKYSGPFILKGLNGKSEGMDLKVQEFVTP